MIATTDSTKDKLFSTESPRISREEALNLLNGSMPTLDLIREAYKIRQEFFGNKVRIHILENVKNGHCAEDCGYCAQRKNSNSGVQEYPMKTDEEIFQEALEAKRNGAYRFCMVSSGRGPTEKSIHNLTQTISRIRNELGMKVCLSAGILDEQKAKVLKEAGLDRYNHNLNTSEAHYGDICTTHTFMDRVKTIEAMNNVGVGLCSGVIVGMGESLSDLVDIAFKVKELKIISIPVNFFIPILGHAIKNPNPLTPELCLRILSVFRFVNPDSEVRVAAGREGHLRSMQAMSLYPANSLFASGYLNVKGSDIQQTVEMIRDLGMEPEFDGEIEYSEPATGGYKEESISEMYKYKKNIEN
ncbi:MAG: biotin synthase BioB [Leptospiraceae bacterium]|nr:biotin synthase BioB [Leptospiraceae bacterium]MCP5511619.1 biotin synthase BioB [Leptospiraceae bacterium]